VIKLAEHYLVSSLQVLVLHFYSICEFLKKAVTFQKEMIYKRAVEVLAIVYLSLLLLAKYFVDK